LSRTESEVQAAIDWMGLGPDRLVLLVCTLKLLPRASTPKSGGGPPSLLPVVVRERTTGSLPMPGKVTVEESWLHL